MMVKDKVYWAGVPGTCNICEAAFSNSFIDGRTKKGPWANMCPKCFFMHGVGLGLGKGQRYEFERSTGKYLKVEG